MMGQAIQDAMLAMARYIRAYKAAYGDDVGDDAILGDLGVKVVLQGLETMLNGELGHREGGKLHRGILAIAADGRLLDGNGEL